MRRFSGEIKDPILGYVYFTEAEKEIIDSYPVQRLRRLRQLAGAEYVYPGANHTRFEHCIGVMHLAGQMTENPFLSQYFSEEDSQMIRIAALLHDVGHGPFSHIFEHLLHKFHDKKNHENINVWIVQKSELKDVIGEQGFDPDQIAKLSVGWLHKPGKAYMDQVIRSAVDADKLDFVVRDTFHTGAQYGYVDVFRLIHTLDVLDQNLAVDMGALSALESFILARIESFKSIYFHRVGRAAQLMLAMAMEEAKDELGLVNFKTPEEYLAFDDYTVWTMLKKSKKAKKIIENLERRKLLKCAYDQTFYVRDKTISTIFSVEEIRNKLQDQIAAEAGVDSKTVVIDVPTLPSVPYSHSVLLEPMEIPVFQRTREGEKTPKRLSDVSGVFDVLKGFINILRVYTDEENREKVSKAATKLLGETPSSAKISF
jgi:HD superfamily phosphohydrolase